MNNEDVSAVKKSRPLLRAAKALSAALGLFALFLGGLVTLLYLTTIVSPSGAVSISTITTTAAFSVLGLGLGGMLAWHSIRALKNQPTARFRLPSVWLLAAVFIVAAVVGQLLINFSLLPTLFFPPIHILATVIPPLVILAAVNRALAIIAPSWREMTIQLVSGAFLSTTLAFLSELLLAVIAFLVIAAVTALFPGGMGLIETLSRNLQDPLWLEDPDNLQQLLSFPPVSITLILVFVIGGPIIEEVVKLLGVVAMSYRHPSAARAFLWGVASGAGFALVENLFNTTVALDVWILIIVLRLGATAMHCLATGLAALGWQRLWVERRPLKFVGAFSLAVGFHILWNMVVVGMVGIGLFAANFQTELLLALSGGAILLLGILFLLLVAGLITTFVIVLRRLKQESLQQKEMAVL